jgi:hypothetical protein
LFQLRQPYGACYRLDTMLYISGRNASTTG